MNQVSSRQKRFNVVLLTIFTLSALIGFAFLGVSVWGDLEASIFDMQFNGEEPLGTLSCPVLITPNETGKISAKISNPINNMIKPSIRLHISSSHLAIPREENIRFQLAPSESKKLDWTVDPQQDAAFGDMVLVKVYMFRNYPIPSKDATCGILVLDLPISSKLFLYGGIGMSFVGMLASIGFWYRNNPLMTKRQREIYRAIWILAASIIIGLLASLFGFWLIGSIGIVVTLLMTFGTIFQMI